jgi:hypothetical protein
MVVAPNNNQHKKWQWLELQGGGATEWEGMEVQDCNKGRKRHANDNDSTPSSALALSKKAAATPIMQWPPVTMTMTTTTSSEAATMHPIVLLK